MDSFQGNSESNHEIFLTEDLFLGKGAHKATYAHPTAPGLCVKIPFTESDYDVRKEMWYRHLAKKQVAGMSVITKYFGKVKTNKGTGYLFERIRDYDGGECRTLEWQLCHMDSMDMGALMDLLLDFKERFMEEKCVINDMDPMNFLIQRLSPTESRIVVIDNIGTGARIPILYYSDGLLRKHAFKYWRLFVHKIMYAHQSVITVEAARKLLEDVPEMKVCVLAQMPLPKGHLRRLSVLGNRLEAVDMSDGFLGGLKGLFRVFAKHWDAEAFYVIGKPRAAMLPLLFAKIFQKPVTLMLADGEASGIFRLCDAYLVPSEDMRRKLINDSGIGQKKVVVLRDCDSMAATLKVQFVLHDMAHLVS